MLFDRDLSADEQAAFEAEKEGHYREISKNALVPMPGLLDLLEALGRHGIAVGLATSAPPENVAHTLAEAGLADRFAAIARGDQVKHGKPAPDVFLHAASLLGVEPTACLAFEDAPLGVASARNAGMCCVAVTSTFSADALMAAAPPPHATCRDFSDFLDGPGRWLRA